MNRLLLTIILAIAFAFSLAQYAHGQTPSTSARHQDAKSNRRTHTAAETPQASQEVGPSPFTLEDDTVVLGKGTSAEKTYIIRYDTGSNPPSRLVSEDGCDSCTLDVPGLGNSFKDLWKSTKPVDKIKEALHKQNEIDIKKANLEKTHEEIMHAKCEHDKEVCNIKDESTCEVTKDNKGKPVVDKVNFESEKPKKDNPYLKYASFEEELPSDTKSEGGLNEQDSCFTDHIDHFKVSASSGDKRALETLNELVTNYQTRVMDLYDRVQASGTPQSSPEYSRLLALTNFNEQTLMKDRLTAPMVADVLSARVTQNYQKMYSAAGGAGASITTNPAAAAQMRQPGGVLSDQAINSYRTTLGNAMYAAQSAATFDPKYTAVTNNLYAIGIKSNFSDLTKNLDAQLAKTAQKKNVNLDGSLTSAFAQGASTSSDGSDNQGKKVFDDANKQAQYVLRDARHSADSTDPVFMGALLSQYDIHAPPQFQGNGRQGHPKFLIPGSGQLAAQSGLNNNNSAFQLATSNNMAAAAIAGQPFGQQLMTQTPGQNLFPGQTAPFVNQGQTSQVTTSPGTFPTTIRTLGG